ncbi:MAG: hypothetical protein DMG89_17460 [Acidobacteria bacterium]|nr:MAG: hypothetical protein DMG89_17460 [Acidobacteriota bacterium]
MAKDRVTGDWIYVSDSDAEKLIKAATDRWRLPFKLLFHYGLRCSEVLAITPAHIKEGCLVLPRLKHGTTPHLHLVDAIRDELLALCAMKDAGTLLFPFSRKAAWRAMRDAGNRAQVDPRVCHPHAMRHRFGRVLARKGASANQLMALMGHRSLRASLMYTSIAADEALSRQFLG